MRLIFEDSSPQTNTADLAASIVAARELAAEQFADDQRLLVLALADRLQASTPPFFLRQLSPRDLADRLLELFRFLSRQEVGDPVRLLPLDGAHMVLLTNTPDAPYLVHTLQLALVRLGVDFQVVCHPILAVRREHGRLAGIGGMDEAGDRESLVVILLHGLAEEQRPAVLAATAAGLDAVLAGAAGEPGPDRSSDRAGGSGDAAGRTELSALAAGGEFPALFLPAVAARAGRRQRPRRPRGDP